MSGNAATQKPQLERLSTVLNAGRKSTRPTESAIRKGIAKQIHQMGGPEGAHLTRPLDTCVGYTRIYNKFPKDQMVCNKTLYNELATEKLSLLLFGLPKVLKRKRRKVKSHDQKTAALMSAPLLLRNASS